MQKQILDLLNKLLELDPKGITDLMTTRTNISQKIAHSKDVDVVIYKCQDDDFYSLSPLGLLNGLIPNERIMMLIDTDTNQIVKFEPFDNIKKIRMETK